MVLPSLKSIPKPFIIKVASSSALLRGLRTLVLTRLIDAWWASESESVIG